MQQSLTLGCAVLAAGIGTRFGGNKQMALYRGRPLIWWALHAVPVPPASQVAVVTGQPGIAELAGALGFQPVHNSQPALGLSHSVALATRALSHCDGILFLVADQPRLRREGAELVAKAWLRQPDRIVCAAHAGRRGSPNVFPKSLFSELLALQGDQGGSAVLHRHPNQICLVALPDDMLRDADTPLELAALE